MPNSYRVTIMSDELAELLAVVNTTTRLPRLKQRLQEMVDREEFQRFLEEKRTARLNRDAIAENIQRALEQ
jgi:hypothetical protein